MCYFCHGFVEADFECHCEALYKPTLNVIARLRRSRGNLKLLVT